MNTDCAEQPKYFFILDDSFQWESYIIALKENGDIVYCGGIDSKIEAGVIRDILERYAYKHNWELDLPFKGRSTYQGWSISSSEYHKLYRIIHLRPSYEEYLALTAFTKT